MSRIERNTEAAVDQGRDGNPAEARASPSDVTSEARTRAGAATETTMGVDLRFTATMEGGSSFPFSQAMTRIGG